MPVTILVADDSATMRRILEMTFAGEDAEVITVDGGEAAVRKAAEIKPDVMFADASLDDMDGYEIARAIKGDGSLQKTAVIVMVSQKRPFDEARGRAAGVDDHIVKPFDTQQVIDRVSDVLARPRATAAAGAAQAQPPAAVAAAKQGAPAPGRGPRTATLAFGSSPMNAAQASVPGGPKPGAAPGTGHPAAPSMPERAPAAAATADPPGRGSAPEPAGRPVTTPFAAGPAGGPSGGAAVAAGAAQVAPAPKPAPPPPKPAAKPAETPAGAHVAPDAPDAPAADKVAAAAEAAQGDLSQKLDGLGLTSAQAEAVLALSREVVERVVWEVVPDLAETIIREELKRLTQ